MSSKNNGNGNNTTDQINKILNGIDLLNPEDIDKVNVVPGDYTVQQKMSVYQTLVNPPKNLIDYRQLLYLGNFKNDRQAMYYADAINLCIKMKSENGERLFIDRMAAMCGVNANRVHDIIHGMNEYNHNITSRTTQSWKKKDNQSIGLGQ